MSFRNVLSILWMPSLTLIASSAFAADANHPDFNRDIRPILVRNCLACHGPDEEAREADLRLDDFQSVTAERDGKRAIVPGKPADSELVKRILTTDTDLIMPPADTGHVLTDEQKQLLQDWIQAGAEFDTHWAFVKPEQKPLPTVKAADWAQQPWDRFILAALETKGLQPTSAADKYQLIRRASLDLTGLPPTIAEVDAFLADKKPDAYERLIDRLLDSPRYGEHWARLWLDLARYADTQGYEKDRHRDIWRYRDWVIEAYNRDLPFDEFTVEQMAGDLLPGATVEKKLATAFHRNTMTNTEGGTDDEEFRLAAVKDRIETTMQVWMGLTMRCANCHSHKYDPLSQREYYQFLAYFNQTQDRDAGNDHPRLATPTREQHEQTASLEAMLKTANDEKTKQDLQQRLAALRKQFPTTPVMAELPEQSRRRTHIHLRGNFLTKGDEVTAAIPAAFHSFREGTPQNRLGIAQWLVAPENPLTARVAVNRVWANLFGIGLVETEEDFGTQGTPPSHPELLDWLAIEFSTELGWSQKKLLKSIMLSATYQQSSQVSEDRLRLDPRNRLLSRGPRFRLAAEMVRDQALAAAGLLSDKMFGPSVMPPQPDGVWSPIYNGAKWQTATGDNRFRRGIYTYWRRTSPYPSMLSFDAGSREVCLIRRVRTNTPLQALVLLNDPVYVEAAGGLAQRMLEHDGDTAAKLNHGLRRVLVRPATKWELERLQELLEHCRKRFQGAPDEAQKLVVAAGVKLPANGDPVESASWATVANVLLNIDEGITKS